MATIFASVQQSRKSAHAFHDTYRRKEGPTIYQLQLNPFDKTPKYKQIVESIRRDINRGVLKEGDQLPSISEMSIEYLLARDTVEKAYRELRAQGDIISIQGKGYYIKATNDKKIKILLIFNKLSSYKKIIYYAFLKALGEQASVDLQIHHYSASRFREIIDKNLGKYNYYVVMPHFTEDTDHIDPLKILETIPPEELILLDRDIPELAHKPLSVYQNFCKDIFESLESAQDLLNKYHHLALVFPQDGTYPPEIVQGFRNFCINYQKEFSILPSISNEIPIPRTAYIVVEESDLAELVKKVRQTPYQLGEEVGIISFNETTLKELLDITVITTDFEHMGREAAHLLLAQQRIKVKNPFFMIRRGSL